MASTETPKAQKALKSKDSSKKSSKKRSLEEQQAAEQLQAPSPSKRQRTDDDDDDEDSSSSSSSDESSEEEEEKPILDTPSKPESGMYTPTDQDLEKRSPFVQQTTSFYLPLSPVAHRFPLQGLCAEHLSPLLLTYYPPLNGVVLSYSNPRLSSTPHNTTSPTTSKKSTPDTILAMAKSIDEYASSYVWLTADFTLLRPQPGAAIEGHVALQNESYLGLVCWNFFNAAIDRRRLPRDWEWVGATSSSSTTTTANGDSSSTISASLREKGAVADWMRGGNNNKNSSSSSSEGYFVDGNGDKVQGLLRFRVKDYESAPSTDRERGFLSIEGTLLNDEQDRKVDAEDKAKAKGKGKMRRGRR